MRSSCAWRRIPWASVVLALWMRHSAPSIASSATDEEIGQQWAVCAAEARILHKHSSNTTGNALVLKQTSAVLGAYAAAVAGEDRANETQALVSEAFWRKLAKTAPEDRHDTLVQWNDAATHRALACASHFEEHHPRLQGRVQALLKASSSRSDSAPPR